ncbi:MAG TPA: MMPL family transporter, partial [Solirubrobacterales bacterium]|nr:MMPL family transporter [Solirubrobacterales bacterium]HMX72213.1 MMPL family transporter [Solirubrobacterales bacterium]
MNKYGPLGRLGRWTTGNFRVVAAVWLVIAIGLGFFAPKAEHALSGAGWEATGSESVDARKIVDQEFGGMSSSALMVVVHSDDSAFGTAAFDRTLNQAASVLRESDDVKAVVMPSRKSWVSADGHTAVIQAGAAADSNRMVRAADDIKVDLAALDQAGTTVSLTGSSGMWSDFNQANKEAMMKSELISWPVTLLILVLAFGSLVAAGLPLMLTIIGLMAAAGSLYLGTQLFDISIWAMNFAMMFALALGIDYALFIVYRFRGALTAHEDTGEAIAETMDTAGKAVFFSGVTVLISLSAVLLVPSPAFRSMAIGVMLAVAFVLAASLTLLPGVLGKLGHRVNRLSLPWVHTGEHRSPKFAAWGERIWARPLLFGIPALLILLALCLPVLSLDTGMPSIKVVPEGDGARVGYEQVSEAFGPGAAGTLQVVAPGDDATRALASLRNDQGIARVMVAGESPGGYTLIAATPGVDPSDPAMGTTIDRVRDALPPGTLVGGAAAENHDLEAALGDTTAPAIAIVMTLGFLLLLIALRAPILAAIAVLTNLLAVGAAFGVAQLIFQQGHLTGLLGIESQGFLDAWAPVFFFAMVFAISMDYSVFLLSSAREHWEKSGDAKEALIGALAHSGRVVFAAAGVMVAVFFTFALSGPLPPREMGIILGVAVLLDAGLVRLMLLPVLM